MRIVLDINVYSSFLLTRGETISRIFDAWENNEFTTLTSSQMFDELQRVLKYPHLKARIKTVEARALLQVVQTDAVLVPGKISKTGVTSDPKDDMVVACAVEGNADYIVSGDPHLLKLQQYENVKIVSPTEFVNILNQLKQ